MQTLGINIGSTSLKMVFSEDGKPLWYDSAIHEGDFGSAAKLYHLEGLDIRLASLRILPI